jgi:hypothetical protein
MMTIRQSKAGGPMRQIIWIIIWLSVGISGTIPDGVGSNRTAMASDRAESVRNLIDSVLNDRIADWRKGADISVPVDHKAQSGNRILSITVAPVAIDPSEHFLVTVSGRSRPNENEMEIGSFSFYPPPPVGETQTFLLPLPASLALSAAQKGTLIVSVRLISPTPDSVT